MQKHQSVSPAGVRGSSVAPGSSTDDSNLLHGPVIILAPPGSGKTHYLEDMRAMGKAQGFHDADDILAEVLDEAAEVPCIEAESHYSGDWDKWQRVCFRELLKKMNTDPDHYAIILTGFMVPKPGANWYDKLRVQLGYSQFIGTGDITNWWGEPEAGFPKIEPKRVLVVLPEIEEYKRRGASRSARPVPPEHCDLCWECFHEVAKSFELQVLSLIHI